ncbi:hypothetical protein BHE90_007968 [Fusarium euwallaceae]|uniref:Mid2 domain-containing protein n=1 Tax=Fusarium euwallaceae TaxID=1147111 RepID=A0A430LPB5_9HYPO|nr:hypothetical protein BHE90_007968 [Fusarium euwallaceae]
MSRYRSFIAFLVATSQICIHTVFSQNGDPVIGYYIKDNTAIEQSCRDGAPFRSSTTFDNDDRTYAFCDPTEDDAITVGTSCDGEYVAVTGEGLPGSATRVRCLDDFGCTTITLCANSINITSRGIETIFLESPVDYRTSSLETTTTADETIEPSISTLTTTNPTQSSGPTPTETDNTANKDIDDQEDTGPDAGIIAGAVVGSVAAVALIGGALVLGFRMGRRYHDQDDDETHPQSFGRSLRNTMSSIPRPAVTWHRPEPEKQAQSTAQNTVSCLQMTFPEDQHGPETTVVSGSAASPNSHDEVKTPSHGSPRPVEGQIQRIETLGSELPTGPDSQGWVRSEAHPLPYEADSTAVYRPSPG